MIIGVTGSLATGKSTVSSLLALYLKCRLIDADKMTRDILSRDKAVQRKVISIFGQDILDKRKSIDRRRLADKAFANRTALKRLCGVLHPIVIDRIKKQAAGAVRRKRLSYVIIDGPLLIETGLHDYCDRLVVVIASLTKQVERAQAFKGMKVDDVMRRVSAQMPLSDKVVLADYIVNNEGDIKELRNVCRELSYLIRDRQ